MSRSAIGLLFAAGIAVAAPGCDTRPARKGEPPADTAGVAAAEGRRTTGAEAPTAGPSSAIAAPAAAAADELAQVRLQAREVLVEHCGKCHIGSSPDAVDAALAVFDLEQPTWYSGLGEAQLESARTRVDSQAAEGQKQIYAAFVSAELATRAAR